MTVQIDHKMCVDEGMGLEDRTICLKNEMICAGTRCFVPGDADESEAIARRHLSRAASGR